MWNNLFVVGSLVASISQGWMLGSYITGLDHTLINVIFSILISLSLPALYLLLGSMWLLVKTQDALFIKSAGWAKLALLPAAIGLVLVLICFDMFCYCFAMSWYVLQCFVKC